MTRRIISAAILAVLAGSLAGCGEKTVASGKHEDYTDPNDYYGSYDGHRVDQDDSATPPSIRELLGETVLTLHDGNSTYSMKHEGVEFGGNYAMLMGRDEQKERIKILELYVYQVGSYQKTSARPGAIDIEANKAAGREPSTPEKLKLYEDILFRISWRFEILEDGFRQLDSNFGPGMYEFTRQRPGSGAGEGSGGEDSLPEGREGGPRIAGT